LKPRGFAEVPKPYHVTFKTTKCGKHEKLAKSIAKKNQGAEPEGHAPQFSLIINRARNANSIFWLAGTPRRALSKPGGKDLDWW
jgi:hypothetical protein